MLFRSESDPALSSSLAYADQSFDSLIGRIGWQASYAISDHLVQYARFNYDHAFEEADEQVFASAQSIPGSVEYTVPGQTDAHNDTTLTHGQRYDRIALAPHSRPRAPRPQRGHH